jgi:chloramphenicol-sensitive protein RarD
MSDERRGVLLGVAAYLCWGLFPLYWPLLKPASALEILSHRVVWSLAFVVLLLLVRREWAWLPVIIHDRRRLLILSVASTVIAVNWGVYIWGVNNGHVVETALGYFINPLVTVLMGVVLLGERLRRAQWAAVGLGALAVLALAVDFGRPPWIALTLAFSFATYGLMKKKVAMPALQSLTVETTLLFVPALAVLAVMEARGTAAFGRAPAHVTVLLACAGVVTAVPLLLFGAAARRVPLSTMGLLQYLTPMMQFILGLVVFHEAMPASRWAGFALVWAALGVFSMDSLRHAQAQYRAADDAATQSALTPEAH